MNATKWTPGPWTAVEDDAIIISADSRMLADMAEIATVETGWDDPFESEQQANARLIAESPMLYEALERIVDASDRFVAETGMKHGDIITDAVDAARTVLARARGES